MDCQPTNPHPARPFKRLMIRRPGGDIYAISLTITPPSRNGIARKPVTGWVTLRDYLWQIDRFITPEPDGNIYGRKMTVIEKLDLLSVLDFYRSLTPEFYQARMRFLEWKAKTDRLHRQRILPLLIKGSQLRLDNVICETAETVRKLGSTAREVSKAFDDMGKSWAPVKRQGGEQMIDNYLYHNRGQAMTDGDFEMLFNYAGPEFRSALEPDRSVDSFTQYDFEDVEKSIIWDPSDSGEPTFYALIKLKSGEWAALEAWHDYTGWDCRSGASFHVAPDRDTAIRLGFGEDARRALGLYVKGANK